MNKKVKEFLKVLFVSTLLTLMMIVPAVLSLGLYFIAKLMYDFGFVSGYPANLSSYFTGAMAGTIFCFLIFMWLVSSKRLTFQKEEKK